MALALLAIAAVDAVFVIYAGTVMGMSGQLRSSATGVVSGLFTVIGAVLPDRFVGGVGAILASLGLEWWQRSLIAPAYTSGAGAGLPALGGAMAAPVYAFVRRASGARARSRVTPLPPPPHRVYVRRNATPPTPSRAVRDAVPAS